MTTNRRSHPSRLAGAAISCTALVALVVGPVLASPVAPADVNALGNGGPSLLRLRLLVSETFGADADELAALHSLIDADDADEAVETPEPAETPEAAETPEPAETPEAAETPESTAGHGDNSGGEQDEDDAVEQDGDNSGGD